MPKIEMQPGMNAQTKCSCCSKPFIGYNADCAWISLRGEDKDVAARLCLPCADPIMRFLNGESAPQGKPVTLKTCKKCGSPFGTATFCYTCYVNG